ncbi:MAG: hypothetical protein AB7D51_13180 [Desulfovibrionaceae bacterium]
MTVKRLLSILLLLALALVMNLAVSLTMNLNWGEALAQGWGKVMTPSRPLNVRHGRSLNTDRVTTIMPGEKVRADFSDGDWVAVFSVNEERREETRALGYVKEKYLEPAPEGAGASWGRLMAPSGMLNVRQERTRNSAHMVTLQPGQVVRVDFSDGDWTAVFQPGETRRDVGRAMGYVREKYLSPATQEQIAASGRGASQPAPAPAPLAVARPAQQAKPEAPHLEPRPMQPEQAAEWGKLVTLSRRANVREERTAGSALVSTIDVGETIRVDFLQRGWYAVFPVEASVRDEARALGYIYAPLLDEPTGELNAHSLLARAQEPEPGSGEAVLPKVLTEPPAREDAREDVPAAPSAQEAESTEQPAAQQSVPQPASPTPASPKPATNGPASLTAAVRAAPGGSGGEPSSTADGRERMVLSPDSQGDAPHKGPVPVADKVRHGFRYGVIERDRSSSQTIGRLEVRIYLDVTVVPTDDALRDFCATIFREEMGDSKELLLLLYLPGQDTKDLAYAQARFTRKGMEEFWSRRSTLYGTGFM